VLDAIDPISCALQACRRPPTLLRKLLLIVANQKLRSPESITDSPTEGGANPPDFERSLAELEAIVDKLEAGELSLDESLKQFERGVQLTRVCQSALKQAEQKVEILMRKSGTSDFATGPFDAADDEEG
jgi:exodeoxyribonuclease VII small subunit